MICEWLEDLDIDLEPLVGSLEQSKMWSVYQVYGVYTSRTKITTDSPSTKVEASRTFSALDVALRPPKLGYSTGPTPWIPIRTDTQNIRATL